MYLQFIKSVDDDIISFPPQISYERILSLAKLFKSKICNKQFLTIKMIT